MRRGFDFMPSLIGSIIVICFLIAAASVAIMAFLVGMLYFTCSYISALVAWESKTKTGKSGAFLVSLVIGMAVCGAITYALNNKELVDTLTIIVIIVFYCVGLKCGHDKGIVNGLNKLNDELRNNLFHNDEYIKFMNEYKQMRDKFDGLGGQLISSNDYMEKIKYFDDYIDMRCFDDVLVLFRNINVIHQIEENLVSENSKNWIYSMYHSLFNKSISINNTNIIDTFIEIVKSVSCNPYLELEVSKIIYYKTYDDNNHNRVEILLDDDNIITLPGCYYPVLMNYYPNLNNRNLY